MASLINTEHISNGYENKLFNGFDYTCVVMQKSDPRKKHKKHGIKMNEDGSCPIDGCDYICKSRKYSTFAMHVTCKHKLITGNKTHSYTCGTCFRTFSSRSIMNNHQEREHEAWKFTCKEDGCGKSCPNKSALLTHHVSKHLHMKEADCSDENGCCVNCGITLPRTGHKNHYARCIGLHHRIFWKRENRKERRGGEEMGVYSSYYF